MMVGIIPEEYKNGTFEKISRGSLNMVVQESEAIIEKVKKASENKDFLSIIYLFEVVNHFDIMKSRLQNNLLSTFQPRLFNHKLFNHGLFNSKVLNILGLKCHYH